MVLTGSASDELFPLGNSKAFAGGFMGLEFRHGLETYDSSESVPLERHSLLDLDTVAQGSEKVIHHGARAVTVLVFTSTEDNFHFHFVPLFEELAGTFHADVPVVLADGERESNALEVNLFLFRLALSILAFHLVHELAVVQDAAHGRLRHRRYLNQIEPALSCSTERILQRYHPHLVILLVDEPNLGDADLVVDAESSLLYGRKRYSIRQP